MHSNILCSHAEILEAAHQALKAPMAFVQRFAAINLTQVKSKL